MVIGSPDAVLFGNIKLVASLLDASNSNCVSPISVVWTAVAQATSYQLERRINSGAWAVVYVGNGLNFTENGSPGTYEYRVKAIRGSQSVYSNVDGVTILVQGLLNTYCNGYDLYGHYRSNCTEYNQLIQALSASCGTVWGCMDATAQNYNASANHSDGSCTWAATSDCPEHTAPFWIANGATTYTIPYTMTCEGVGVGTGTLTGFYAHGFAGGTNLTQFIIVESYEYDGDIVTIRFHTPLAENKWFYAQFGWTGVQRLS